MSFSKLFPNPIKLITGTLKAPFEKRNDQPWLQSTARNLGHAAFGDYIGDRVDNRLLGDYGGYRKAENNPALQQQTGAALTPPAMSAMPTLPTNTKPNDDEAAKKLLLAWIQKRQGNQF